MQYKGSENKNTEINTIFQKLDIRLCLKPFNNIPLNKSIKVKVLFPKECMLRED